jgi:hypothetical protein
MNKLRSDSAWTRLTAEQRARLESWLFDQHLSYRAAFELVKKEFGMGTSMTSFQCFGRRLAEERERRQVNEELLGALETGDDPDERLEKLRAAGETFAAQRMVELAVLRPERIREFTALGRLMVRTRNVELKLRRIALERSKLDASIEAKEKSGQSCHESKHLKTA